jgi:hypothetical protein
MQILEHQLGEGSTWDAGFVKEMRASLESEDLDVFKSCDDKNKGRCHLAFSKLVMFFRIQSSLFLSLKQPRERQEGLVGKGACYRDLWTHVIEGVDFHKLSSDLYTYSQKINLSNAIKMF